MPFALHHRASSIHTCYGLPSEIQFVRRQPNAAAGFPHSFRGARSVRSDAGSRAAVRRERSVSSKRPEGTVWPAAFAIMLVANLATPAAGMVPKREPRPAPEHLADYAVAATFAPEAQPRTHAPASSEVGDVIIQPLALSSIKSDYTFHDFLKAVAAARAPFHYLGESVGDAYEVLSGQEVDPGVRRGVQIGTDTLDLATGLLPNVRMLRLPGELADIAVDELDGRVPSAEKIAGVLQYGDPRSLGPASRSHAESSGPAGSPSAPRPVTQYRPVQRVGAKPLEPRLENVDPGDPFSEPVEDEAAGAVEVARAAPFPSTVDQAPAPAPASPFYIVDEQAHLRGYEQQLPAEQLPADDPSRVVVVNGHYYLKGEAGYYRAQRGISADHWLIDAPQGSESRAQVPVTYDANTGQWHAHAPLRMCGGGCVPSRLAQRPDSIAASYDDIFDAVRHLPDEDTQEAIQYAFAELSELHLRRTNRADLQSIRDNSIINHRAALRGAMKEQIDPDAPLVKQQRIASEITTLYYQWGPSTEAFCQENAEILFHFLLDNGISKNRIRMITIKPQNRPPHVMVLYTESEHLIALMDRSTLQPPHPLRRDGISHEFFREAAYLTRHSTILLDPWSRTKAISFAGAANRFDAGRIINRALVDIGHTPGSPYTVSVTRPLGNPKAHPRGSTGEAHSPGQSTSNTESRGNSPSSEDTELSDAGPASSN